MEGKECPNDASTSDLEVPARIALAHGGFAVPCLTAWLRHPKEMIEVSVTRASCPELSRRAAWLRHQQERFYWISEETLASEQTYELISFQPSQDL